MGILDRIMLSIYALFVTVVSAVLILLSTGRFGFDRFSTGLHFLYGRWETGIAGIVLLIISLRFLFYGLKSKQPSEAVVSESEFGKVCITLKALESLVLKTIQDIDSVKDSNIIIRKRENGVSILLKLTINHDIIIPDMATELQRTIKEHIETSAGILVKDIGVSVNSVSNQSQQKVAR